MTLDHFLAEQGWQVVSTEYIGPRSGELCDLDDLALSPATAAYLQASVSGVYQHQRAAIEAALAGKNVCMTTGTASGKSLPFYTIGIEHLVRSPEARIIAVYPLKALGREQEDRWKQALKRAGLPPLVGRIDGQVPTQERLQIIKMNRVVIITPDTIHAWLLSSLNDKTIRAFLSRVSLLIVDEIHTYTGVFGSNAAFLFRRLQHVMALLGAYPRYICASATISEPTHHLQKLFGEPFTLVGPEMDTSPKHPVEIRLLNPPKSAELLTDVPNLLAYLAMQTTQHFIAFMDSRKQVEHITSILARPQEYEDPSGTNEEEDQEDGMKELKEDGQAHDYTIVPDYLQMLDVLPFRAGYIVAMSMMGRFLAILLVCCIAHWQKGRSIWKMRVSNIFMPFALLGKEANMTKYGQL